MTMRRSIPVLVFLAILSHYPLVKSRVEAATVPGVNPAGTVCDTEVTNPFDAPRPPG